MTGASVAHNAIVGNIFGQLWTQMKGRPRQVYANDLKVRIRSADAVKYPDLIALCGEHKFRPPDPVTKNQQDTSAAERLS